MIPRGLRGLRPPLRTPPARPTFERRSPVPLSTPSFSMGVSDGRRLRSLHPLHAFLLAASVPLFLGALLSDLTYFSSHEVQWKNFASWLIIGGLIFGGFALLWAL